MLRQPYETQFCLALRDPVGYCVSRSVYRHLSGLRPYPTWWFVIGECVKVIFFVINPRNSTINLHKPRHKPGEVKRDVVQSLLSTNRNFLPLSLRDCIAVTRAPHMKDGKHEEDLRTSGSLGNKGYELRTSTWHYWIQVK